MLMPDSCWSLTFTSPMLSSYHLHWGNLVLWLELSGEESLSLWNAHLSKVCSCQVSTAPRDCISKTLANIVSFHMHELESDHPLHHQSAMSDHHHQHSRTLKLLWETWTQILWYYYWSRTCLKSVIVSLPPSSLPGNVDRIDEDDVIQQDFQSHLCTPRLKSLTILYPVWLCL